MFYTDPAFAGGAIAAVGLLYMYIQYRRALPTQTRPKLKRPAGMGWGLVRGSRALLSLKTSGGGWSGGPELHSHATVAHAPSYIIIIIFYYYLLLYIILL